MSQVSQTVVKTRKSSFVEDMLLGVTIEDAPKLVPGVLLAAAIVVVSVLLTNWINQAWGFKSLISYIMMAIVIGLVVRTAVGIPTMCQPGVTFCLRKLLRLGIMMMGIRLSIFDAAKIGIWGVPIVIIAVATGLVVTSYFARWLKLSDRLGTLIAVGTGICGASAIVATAPSIEAKDEEVTYAIANITIFGIMAMFVYPYLSNVLFGGNVVMAGLFQGTSIHETAQVTGAGLIYDQTFHVTGKPTAADVAVVTKLVRNVFMLLVIPLMAFLYTRQAGQSGETHTKRVNIVSLFPLFILGFIAMAIARSIGDAGIQGSSMAFNLWNQAGWREVTGSVANWAGYVLATAMAGVGLGTSLQSLRGLGLKPFYIGLLSATAVGVAALVAVLLLGPQVRF